MMMVICSNRVAMPYALAVAWCRDLWDGDESHACGLVGQKRYGSCEKRVTRGNYPI
jgi:hypothetical protein